jgi:hypothetical protein
MGQRPQGTVGRRFYDGMRNPKWGESAAKAEARYARGQNGGKKKAANMAEADREVDYERDIPF